MCVCVFSCNLLREAGNEIHVWCRSSAFLKDTTPQHDWRDVFKHFVLCFREQSVVHTVPFCPEEYLISLCGFLLYVLADHITDWRLTLSMISLIYASNVKCTIYLKEEENTCETRSLVHTHCFSCQVFTSFVKDVFMMLPLSPQITSLSAPFALLSTTSIDVSLDIWSTLNALVHTSKQTKLCLI